MAERDDNLNGSVLPPGWRYYALLELAKASKNRVDPKLGFNYGVLATVRGWLRCPVR